MSTFTNQARLSYNGNITDSNIVRGEVLEVMTARKDAIRSTYAKDDKVSYVVSVKNSGTTPMSNLTVNDNLGAYTVGANTYVPLTYETNTAAVFIDGEKITGFTVVPGPILVISGITLPAGKSATIVYEAKVNEYAPLAVNSTITNQAVVTATDITSVTVNDVISTLDEPILRISKSISPNQVTENGELTYTLTVQNFGNTPVSAATDASIRDTFNPVLKNISVKYGTTNWAPVTDYSYSEQTGVFETATGKLIVPAATFVQGTDGIWSVNPGEGILTIKGTI